ncbi:MAG: acetyl-CoA carboxylase biotin carboxyl carrier protein [Phycisphaerales bacterium]|nr:acetyl-CoA carboxylase biotin carboxyl carrier protein [Phycisphaerales bacterium]
MDYKQIQDLVKMINKSNISELSIKDGEFEITIKQESGLTGTPVYAQPVVMSAPVGAPIAAPAAAPSTAAPSAASEAPAANNDKLHTIKSPMIGTFYRSPSPEKPPFVNVGDEVKQGQPICIVEAMKLFNEIECEVNGRVVKVLVDEASPIEYDQPMFIIELN